MLSQLRNKLIFSIITNCFTDFLQMVVDKYNISGGKVNDLLDVTGGIESNIKQIQGKIFENLLARGCIPKHTYWERYFL